MLGPAMLTTPASPTRCLLGSGLGHADDDRFSRDDYARRHAYRFHQCFSGQYYLILISACMPTLRFAKYYSSNTAYLQPVTAIATIILLIYFTVLSYLLEALG